MEQMWTTWSKTAKIHRDERPPPSRPARARPKQEHGQNLLGRARPNTFALVWPCLAWGGHPSRFKDPAKKWAFLSKFARCPLPKRKAVFFGGKTHWGWPGEENSLPEGPNLDFRALPPSTQNLPKSTRTPARARPGKWAWISGCCPWDFSGPKVSLGVVSTGDFSKTKLPFVIAAALSFRLCLSGEKLLQSCPFLQAKGACFKLFIRSAPSTFHS